MSGTATTTEKRALLPLDVSTASTTPSAASNILLWPPPNNGGFDDSAPPEETRLWRLIGVNQYTLLTGVTLLGAAWQLVFCIVLAVTHVMNIGHFTYWSLCMYTAQQLALASALLLRRGTLTFVVLWLQPIVLGTTALVSVGIVVILSLDATAFINGSTCEAGGTTTIERLHTGDWLLHVLPVVQTQVEMMCGLLDETRDITRGRQSRWTRAQTALYRTFFVLVPLLPLGVYGSVFDVRHVYSIAPPEYLVWLGAIAFVVIVQLVYLLAFTLQRRHKRRLEPADWWWIAAAVRAAAIQQQQQQLQQQRTADGLEMVATRCSDCGNVGAQVAMLASDGAAQLFLAAGSDCC